MKKILFILLSLALVFSSYKFIIPYYSSYPNFFYLEFTDFDVTSPQSSSHTLCPGEYLDLGAIHPIDISFGRISLSSACSEVAGSNDCDVDYYRNAGLIVPWISKSGYVEIVSSSEFSTIKSEANTLSRTFGAVSGSILSSRVKSVAKDNSGFSAHLYNNPTGGADVRYGLSNVGLVCKGSYKVSVYRDGDMVKVYSGSLSDYPSPMNYRFSDSGTYRIEYDISIDDCIGVMEEVLSPGGDENVYHLFTQLYSGNLPHHDISREYVYVEGDSQFTGQGTFTFNEYSCGYLPNGVYICALGCYTKGNYESHEFLLSITNDGDQPVDVYLPSDELITSDVLENLYLTSSDRVDPFITVPPHKTESKTFRLNAYAPNDASTSEGHVTLPLSVVLSSSQCSSVGSNLVLKARVLLCDSNNPGGWTTQTGLDVTTDLKPDEITVDNIGFGELTVDGNVNSDPDNLIPEGGTVTVDSLDKVHEKCITYVCPQGLCERCVELPENCLNNPSQYKSSIDSSGNYHIIIPRDDLTCDIDFNDIAELRVVVNAEYNGVTGQGSDVSKIDTTGGQPVKCTLEYVPIMNSGTDYNWESVESYEFTAHISKDPSANIEDMKYDCGDGQEVNTNDESFVCDYSISDLETSDITAKFKIEYKIQDKTYETFCTTPVGLCQIYLG